jgi:sporulation protein YlmC with PRC-barrel domain
MWTKLALAAAVAATMAGGAYAQQPSTPALNPPAANNPPAVTPSTPPPAAQPNTAVNPAPAIPNAKTDQVLTTLPKNTMTVTNYYKQDLYDSSDNKIGQVSDVLVNREGKIDALIVSVGGFLGIGEKDVAVPFDAVHGTEKNGRWYLTMNTTKDALQNAPNYRYDRSQSTWIPA